jgi:hypothetical protein
MKSITEGLVSQLIMSMKLLRRLLSPRNNSCELSLPPFFEKRGQYATLYSCGARNRLYVHGPSIYRNIMEGHIH